MKSKKAIEARHKTMTLLPYPIYEQTAYIIATYSAELAEEDARDRAIFAYRQSCKYVAIGNMCTIDGYCECQMDADTCRRFMDIYDNAEDFKPVQLR